MDSTASVGGPRLDPKALAEGIEKAKRAAEEGFTIRFQHGRGTSFGFFKVLKELWDLHVERGGANGYGTGGDPFFGVNRAAEIMDVDPSAHALSLLATKIARLEAQLAAGRIPKDTLMDMAAYAMIALTMLEREDAAF